MPSNSDRLALTNNESPMTPAATSASVAPRTPSKGPPPLPKMAAPAVPRHDGSPVEEIFFQEGVDGHADSVSSSGEHAFALEGSHPLSSAETGSTPASPDDEWLDVDEEIEDPARARRRRAARIGVAWGVVVSLVLVGVAAFVSPRAEERSAALSASLSPVAAVAQAPVAMPIVATPPGPAAGPLSTAVTSPRAPVGATTGSVAAAAPVTARAVARTGSPSSPATRPASTSPKAPGARAKRALTPSAPRAASARGRR